MLWIGYQDIKDVLIEINNHADIIRFSSRAGFFIVALGPPPIHLLAVVNYFWPNIPKKHSHIVNKGVIVAVVLLAAGFAGSSWIRSQAKNNGYVYCRNASGISVLAKSLVYTKDMKICEDLVAPKKNMQ